MRLGVAKLGLRKDKTLVVLGKHDGEYKLPTGEHVEFSEWKEPAKSTSIRVFYNRQGQVVQVSTNAPLAATADGASIKSPLNDVSQKYKDLKHSKYRVKDARVNYYDDVKRGICFEFSAAAGVDSAEEHMYAILVHAPGCPVLPDADERPAGKL